MLFRTGAGQAGAAKAAPRCRACQSSSGRPPRTKPSAAFSYYAGSSPPSTKPGDDKWHIANVGASPIHTNADFHSSDTRTPLASGRPPGTVGKPPRRRTLTETRAESSETEAAAPPYTIACGLLKQPDKLKAARSQVSGVRSQQEPRRPIVSR